MRQAAPHALDRREGDPFVEGCARELLAALGAIAAAGDHVFLRARSAC
jgi:hypothetical protein